MNIRNLLLSMSGMAAVIIGWEVVSVFKLVPWILLPPLEDVFIEFFRMLQTGEIFLDAGYSLLRVGLGFIIAAGIAIPLGVIVGWFQLAFRIFDPLIEVMRPIPPLAWTGLALLWFGIGLGSSVFLVFLGAFFPILLNAISGVKGIEKKLIEAAYLLGASQRQVLTKVVIPGSLPSMFTGIRIGMGVAWMVVVAAEMIAARHGLGSLIIISTNLGRTDRVLISMLVIGIFGLVIDYALRNFSRRLFIWRDVPE
jgi:NitT/TauT family transport system permease protein